MEAAVVHPDPRRARRGVKREYTPAPWPADATPVPNMHPGLQAHSYRNGQWTNYLIMVPLTAKEFVERARKDVEEQTGQPCYTRNVYLERNGTAEWWMSVSIQLLRHLNQISQPDPEQEALKAARQPAMDPKTYGKKLAAVDVITAKIAELDALIGAQMKGVLEGDYIPMNKSQQELMLALRAQRLAFRGLSAKFIEALDLCRDEV